MEFEWDLKDVRREWPKITMIVGVGVLWTFLPPLWSGEKPWPASEARLATAKVLDATHQESSNSRVDTVRYAYAVNGRSFAGEYTCGGCRAIEHVRTGEWIPIEYRLEDPERSRPSGAMTTAKLMYWRIGAVVGVLLLGIGLAGFWVRHGKSETAEMAANGLRER